MNKHDQRRKDALVKTLLKAKEQGETTQLYLSVNEDVNELEHIDVAMQHIDIALAHLSKAHDGTACRVCGCTYHHPCPEGCYWVEADLCSVCAEKTGHSNQMPMER